MIGWFMIAARWPTRSAAAVGGALLGLNGVLGLAGWQWVFWPPGRRDPDGRVVLLALPDGPETAPWLSPAQRDWLARTLRAERTNGGLVDHGNPFAALLDRRVLMLAGVYICLPLAAYGARLLAADRGQGLRRLEPDQRPPQHHPLMATAVALWWVPRHAAPHRRAGRRP